MTEKALVIQDLVNEFLDAISIYQDDIQEEIVSAMYLIIKTEMRKKRATPVKTS